MFKCGDRVKALVPTLCGWKGSGTVVRHAEETVELIKDGDLRENGITWTAIFYPHELELLADQTPFGMHSDEIEALARQQYPFA